MDIKILREDGNELELEIASLTLAELLKSYLNKDSNVEFAAWRREHPSKNPILKIIAKGKKPKKAISDAVSLIAKDTEKIQKEFTSLK
ncbi:DNA-directed RNA polymerase subunit L [Candidatus Pacearchaeota archaeon]|nr:DNA-directed RNA polymerase subunit L [Candidatus Pacearchaeota archaeon]